MIKTHIPCTKHAQIPLTYAVLEIQMFRNEQPTWCLISTTGGHFQMEIQTFFFFFLFGKPLEQAAAHRKSPNERWAGVGWHMVR